MDRQYKQTMNIYTYIICIIKFVLDMYDITVHMIKKGNKTKKKMQIYKYYEIYSYCFLYTFIHTQTIFFIFYIYTLKTIYLYVFPFWRLNKQIAFSFHETLVQCLNAELIYLRLFSHLSPWMNRYFQNYCCRYMLHVRKFGCYKRLLVCEIEMIIYCWVFVGQINVPLSDSDMFLELSFFSR